MDFDSFSSGQLLSKIWLAEKLETVIKINDIDQPLNILCLGGWYGITNLVLRTRNNIKVTKFRSVDVDADACKIADKINNSWEWQQWQFKSICADANAFEYLPEEYNLVINTSVEHFKSREWFNNIPPNTLVVLQSNNMNHDDHCHNHNSLESFIEDYKLSNLYYSGEKLFQYLDWKFNRYMIIGLK